MLLNLMVAENMWTVFGLRPAVLIYGLTIAIAWHIGTTTRYRPLVTGLLTLFIIMRLLGALEANSLILDLALFPLAIIYIVAGATIYGNNPKLLHRQLVLYLALSIPVMIVQILGISPLFMAWDTSFLDDTSSQLSASDIGSFKDLPLYPTLFVEEANYYHSISQSRPCGLMYNPNPLSVYVAIAIAINLVIVRSSRLRFSNFVIIVASVLTMSKLVFGTIIVLYLAALLLGSAPLRIRALKLIAVFLLTVATYYFFFPGVFLANTSEEMIGISIQLRLLDLMRSLGLESFFPQIMDLGDIYKPYTKHVVSEEGYSTFGILLKSKWSILSFFLLVAGLVLYWVKIRRMAPRSTIVYIATLVAIIITQFAVPAYAASLFQLLLGFALFPLFSKLHSPVPPDMTHAYVRPQC